MFYPALMMNFYRFYQPKTKACLIFYEKQATQITDPKLKKEALASLKQKAFHCYGASFYASLVPQSKQSDYLCFMTAYQSICDYLDNLVDQTPIINETNFRRLHQSLLDVFKLTPPNQHYYQYQTQQLDSGYLNLLVRICQRCLRTIDNYKRYQPYFSRLARLYVDLQVYKHLKVSEREERLKQLKVENEKLAEGLTWFEFGAACGSTLGIFTMVAYAMNQEKYQVTPDRIFQSMFPGVQQLHIMLDYVIDLPEDLADGELNFFSYYKNDDEGIDQILELYRRVQREVEHLPEKVFHQTINDGLFALYLAEGLRKNPMLRTFEKKIMKNLGLRARFLLHHTKKFVRS